MHGLIFHILSQPNYTTGEVWNVDRNMFVRLGLEIQSIFSFICMTINFVEIDCYPLFFFFLFQGVMKGILMYYANGHENEVKVMLKEIRMLT